MKIILLLVLSLNAHAFIYGDGRPNHAGSDENYIDTADRFIERRLKTSGRYDLIKANAFLERIKSEKEYFFSHLYETALIEEIELQLSKPSKALEEAEEELDEKKSAHAIAFNQYLIPRLEKLIEAIEDNGECPDLCDGLMDEFLAVYSAFYSPDRYRNYFFMDANIEAIWRHRDGYNIPNRGRVEANNLIVGEYERELERCLGRDLVSTHFLNSSELSQIENCGFDLSKLNPGKSFFWNKPTIKFENIFSQYDEYFPRSDEKIYYKHVKFSGRGSPKIKGQFKRGGKKYGLKVKLGGKEPHTENFVSRMGRLVGLYQDPTQYRDRVDIYFKDMDDYNEFQNNMYRKFGERHLNFVESVEDYEEGKKLTVRYSSLEITPDDLHKLGTPDVFGWDHKNRREFRGVLLWTAFLNIVDLKNMNWRMQLRETENGLQPELSMQDTGFSMGHAHTFQNNLLQAAEMEFQSQRNVNGFENQFVFRRGDQVNVQWNDFMSYATLYETTTYNDLKWMARQIARISLDDFKAGLDAAGYSEAEKELYLRKLASRRDHMLEVFDLQDEIASFNLAPAEEYQLAGIVENGRIIDTSVGSATPFIQSPNILAIGGFLQQRIDLNVFNEELQLAIGNELGGHLDVDLDYNIVENKNFSVYLANPGIEVGFVREIRDSRFIQYDVEGDRKFYAVDRYSIAFTSKSGITGELSKLLPVELQAEVIHFKFNFDHYRPFSTIQAALKSRAMLMDVLPSMKEYIKHMGRNEYITYATETGLKLSFELGEGQNYRVEVGHERIKSNPITFTRNQFGEYEIFQEKVHQRRNYVELSVGIDIPLFYLPILGVEFSFMNYDAESKLYAFPLERSTLDDAISQDHFETNQYLLNDLIDGNFDNPLLDSKIKYDLQMNGTAFSRRGFLAMIFGNNLDRIYSKTNTRYKGEKPKTFHRYYIADENTVGIDNHFSAHLLWYKDKATVEVQLDDEEPEDFVVILNNYTFKRDLTKYGAETFIENQNRLYSHGEDFFIKDVLPPAEEVNHYRKVMSHVRVFLYAEKFLEKLDKLMDGELNGIVERHMARGINPIRELRAGNVYNGLRRIRTLFRSAQYSKQELVSALGHLIRRLNTQDYGVGVLKELFGKKHMFVMGEIYGILPSFSYTQDGNATARRRFTGRSWGKYRKRPPFWKYLTDFPIMVRPGMIPYRIDEELFLPALPTNEEALF